MLSEIRLSGELRDAVGRDAITLDVRDVREAIHALATLYPQSRRAFERSDWKIAIGNEALVADEHVFAPTRGKTITLLPVPHGAGDGGGIAKVFAGIFLTALSFGAYGAVAAAGNLGAKLGFITAGAALKGLGVFGAAIGLTGISAVIAPTAESDYNAREEQSASFAFTGPPPNLVSEGHPVPLCFGKARCGSVVVSSGIETEQQGTTDFSGHDDIFSTEITDQLSSIAYQKIIDVISEGPIEGVLPNGVFFNEERYEDGAGTPVDIDRRVGLPFGSETKGPVEFIDSVSSPLTVTTPGVAIPKASPRPLTVDDAAADEVRIRLAFPDFYRLDDAGKRKAVEVRFKIEVKTNLGSYETVAFGREIVEETPVGVQSGTIATGAFRFDVQAEATAIPWNVVGLLRSDLGRYRYRYREQPAGAWVYTDWKPADPRYATLGKGLRAYFFHSGEIASDPTKAYDWEVIFEHRDDPGTPVAIPGTFSATGRRHERRDFVTLRGKTEDPNFAIDYRIPLEDGGEPHTIRVTRLSDDPDNQKVYNDIFLAAAVAVYKSRFEFPDTARVALKFSAKDFGSTQIPRRAYETQGIKVPVPNGYDAFERTYPDPWDGTFTSTLYWTDNPALLLLEYLRNPRWGMGLDLATQIDRYSLFECARYCDDALELTPAPNETRYGQLLTGLADQADDKFAPRFSFNHWFAEQTDPLQIASAIAASARIVPFYGSDGKVYFGQDRGADPARNFTRSNVVEGRFEYAGGALSSKKTAIYATWYDAESNYAPRVHIEEDLPMVQRFGLRPKNVTLIGCTNLSEAIRRARWELDGLRYEARTAKWQLGPGDAFFAPMQIARVADEDFAEIAYGARCAPGSTTTVVKLDREFDVAAGKTYELSVQLPDDTIETKPITDPVATGYTEVTLGSALSAAPNTNAIWTIARNDLEPRQFRALTIADASEGRYDVVAVEHDPDKYARVEDGIVADPRGYIDIDNSPMAQPTSVTVAPYLTAPNVYDSTASALVSWSIDPDPRVLWFEWRVREDDDDFPGLWEPWNLTPFNSVDLSPWPSGQYEFQVRSLDTLQRRTSQPSSSGSVSIRPETIAPADVSDFRAYHDTIPNPEAVRLTWSANPEANTRHYEIRYQKRAVGAADRWNAASTMAIVIHDPRLDFYEWEYHAPVTARVGNFMVKAVNYALTPSDGEAAVGSGIITASGTNRGFLNFASTGTWPGTKSGTTVVSNELLLTGSPGSYGLLGDITNGVAAPTTTAAGGCDLNSVQQVYLNADIDGTGNGATSDETEGYAVETWIRYSEENVAAPTTTWTPWFPLRERRLLTLRHFEAKLILYSLDGGGTSPKLKSAAVWADN